MYKKLIFTSTLFVKLASQCVAAHGAASLSVAAPTKEMEAETKKEAAQFDNVATMEIFEALSNDNVKKLDAVLKKGNADVNAISNQFPYRAFTPLGYALTRIRHCQNKVALVSTLLAHGADQTQKVFPSSHSALHCVSRLINHSSPALLQVLLESNKALLNIKDGRGNTPLMEAVIAIGDGKTHYFRDRAEALKETNTGIAFIKTLLTYEPDLTVVNQRGQNVFALARVIGNQALIEFLTKYKVYKRKIAVNALMHATPGLEYSPPGLLELITEFVD